MAHGLEARTPFLDRDLIDFAQSTPASVKMRTGPDGTTTEKWILRKACEDLLPQDLVWRKKAQFDEGTGTVDVLEEALSIASGESGPFNRVQEQAIYEHILRDQFENPDMILAHAGTWTDDRVTPAT
jgi:asparagine synthase (glutamine-hydrolysing)